MNSLPDNLLNGAQTIYGNTVRGLAVQGGGQAVRSLNLINAQNPLTGDVDVRESGYTFLVGDPNQSYHVANKKYVDENIVAGSVTKGYVDQKDAETLAAGKVYTDGKVQTEATRIDARVNDALDRINLRATIADVNAEISSLNAALSYKASVGEVNQAVILLNLADSAEIAARQAGDEEVSQQLDTVEADLISRINLRATISSVNQNVADLETRIDTKDSLTANDQALTLLLDRIDLYSDNPLTQTKALTIHGPQPATNVTIYSENDTQSNSILFGQQIVPCLIEHQQNIAGQIQSVLQLKSHDTILSMNSSGIELNKPITTTQTSFEDNDLITKAYAQGLTGSGITQEQMEAFAYSKTAVDDFIEPVETELGDHESRIAALESAPISGSSISQNNTRVKAFDVAGIREVQVDVNDDRKMTVGESSVAIKHFIATDQPISDQRQNPENSLPTVERTRELLDEQASVVNAYTDTKFSQEAQSRTAGDASTLSSANNYTSQQIGIVNGYLTYKMNFQKPNDRTQLRANHLGWLTDTGTILAGSDPILAVVSDDDNAYTMASRGFIIDTNAKEEIKYDTQYLTKKTAQTAFPLATTVTSQIATAKQESIDYTDFVVAGFSLTGGSDPGFNIKDLGKNLQLLNSVGNDTGIVISETTNTLLGDFSYQDATNTDPGTKTYEQRKNLIPSCRWVDDNFIDQSTLEGAVQQEATLRAQGDSGLQTQIDAIDAADYQTQTEVAFTIANSLQAFYTKTQSDLRFKQLNTFDAAIKSSDTKNQIAAETNNNGIIITCDGTAVGRIQKQAVVLPDTQTPLQIASTSGRLSLNSATDSISLGTAENNLGVYISSNDNPDASTWNQLAIGSGTGKTGIILSNGHLDQTYGSLPYSTICADKINTLNTLQITADSSTNLALQQANTILIRTQQASDAIKTAFNNKTGYASGLQITENNQFVSKSYCDGALRPTSGYYNCANNRLALIGPAASGSDALQYQQLINGWYSKTQTDSLFTSHQQLTSKITADSNLDFGSFCPLSSVTPTQLYQLANKNYVDGAISQSGAKLTYTIILSYSATEGFYPGRSQQNCYIYSSNVPSSWKLSSSTGNGWFYNNWAVDGYQYYIQYFYEHTVVDFSQWRITSQILGSPKIYNKDVDMNNSANQTLLKACNNYASCVTYNWNSSIGLYSLFCSIGQFDTSNSEHMVEITFTQR